MVLISITWRQPQLLLCMSVSTIAHLMQVTEWSASSGSKQVFPPLLVESETAWTSWAGVTAQVMSCH